MSPAATTALNELEAGKKHHTAELKKKLTANEKAKHTQALKNIEVKVLAVHAAEAKKAEVAKPLLSSALARDVEELKEQVAALTETVEGLTMLLPKAPAPEKQDESK